MARRATIADVAAAAGVHRSTAARALNPATAGMISGATVARVQRSARRLDYSPNELARGLRTKRTLTVGVVVPDLTNPLFPPILRGVEEALAPHGYTALVANTDGDPGHELAALRALLARQVDGLVVATARQRDPMLDEAVQRGARVVLVNRGAGGHRLPLVASDDPRGVRDAVEHLLGLGHRKVAHVAGPAGVSTARDRAEAFRRAVRGHRLPARETPVVRGTAFSEEAGVSAAHRLLDAHPGVTAVVAANDLLALGVLRALAARGLRCPRDVSVVGFNDMRFADALAPPLTTVRIAHRRLGTEAGRLLLEQIEHPGTAPRTVLLPCELVVRRSTSRPRRS